METSPSRTVRGGLAIADREVELHSLHSILYPCPVPIFEGMSLDTADSSAPTGFSKESANDIIRNVRFYLLVRIERPSTPRLALKRQHFPLLRPFILTDFFCDKGN